MDLQQALDAALVRQRRLQNDRDEIDGQLADLAIEVRGLQMALERHLATEDIERTSEDIQRTRNERAAWIELKRKSLQLSRTDAILSVLGAAGRPMTPTEIRDALHELGREDEYNAVSAALAHLAKSERARSVGRAQWVAGPEAPTTDKGREILDRLASGKEVRVRRADGTVVRLRHHDDREPDAKVESESEVETNS
jgi:hypothetical protein